jgi:hypothetical protein
MKQLCPVARDISELAWKNHGKPQRSSLMNPWTLKRKKREF